MDDCSAVAAIPEEPNVFIYALVRHNQREQLPVTTSDELANNSSSKSPPTRSKRVHLPPNASGEGHSQLSWLCFSSPLGQGC